MKLGEFKVRAWSQEQYKLRKEKWQQLQHRKWLAVAVVCTLIVLFLLIIYLFIIPPVSNFAVTRLKQLRNRSHVLETWKLQPVPFITRIYLWNLTNADEVSKGISNPRFTQAGPYVFQQRTKKIPIKYMDDTIEYKSRTEYKYRADLSAPASLDDTVVNMQAALYGAAVKVESIAPAFLSLIDDAVPSLFPGLKSIFAEFRVGDYLFDGVRLRCSKDSPPTAKMVCGTLSNQAPPTIRRIPGSTDFAFSFFAHKNFTDQGPFEENRGINDIRQVGKITKYKGKSVLDIWQPGSRCDTLRGTDTLTFSPFITKHDIIEIFAADICQVLPLRFQKEDYMQNLQVYKFGVSRWLESSVTNPENSCYCTESNKKFCKINGLRDISECMDAPVIMSLPHFLHADQEYLEYAAGANPDPELHSSELYIEPLSGIPVKAAKRVQFNMPLRRISGFSLVQNVSEGLLPLLWLEETIMLSDEALRPVTGPLWILWLSNMACIILMVLLLLVTVGSITIFLYVSRLWCFHNITSNRVTTLFYRPRTPSTVSK